MGVLGVGCCRQPLFMGWGLQEHLLCMVPTDPTASPP